MCRVRLRPYLLNVSKMYIEIANITNIIVDYNLRIRHIYIIHNILAAHNLIGFMDELEMDKDAVIDSSTIDKDMLLTYKIT
jgi:hypothetical protein